MQKASAGVFPVFVWWPRPYACCLLSLQALGRRSLLSDEYPGRHEHRYFILDFLGLGFASGRSVRSHRAREVHHIEFAC